MSLPVVTRPAAAAEIETAYRFHTVRKDIRRAVLRRFPYSIFYRIVSGHVVVIACFHGKRNPRVWRSRR